MLGATGSPMMSVRNTWDEGSEGKLCRDPWEDAVPRGELAKLAQCCRVQGAHTGRSLLVTLRPVGCEPWTPGTLGALPPWFWGTPLSFPMPLISASPFPLHVSKCAMAGDGWGRLGQWVPHKGGEDSASRVVLSHIQTCFCREATQAVTLNHGGFSATGRDTPLSPELPRCSPRSAKQPAKVGPLIPGGWEAATVLPFCRHLVWVTVFVLTVVHAWAHTLLQARTHQRV